MSSNSPNADHSFSIEQTVECPGCRQSFESSPWLIVDADARRDLVERIVAGRLHEVTCPKCARSGLLDLPLLVYRSAASPRIVFSPAQPTSAKDDEQHARGLIGRLRESLGDEWDDQWLAEALSSVPRARLPGWLTGDDDASSTQTGEGGATDRELPPTVQQLLQEIAAELAVAGIAINSPDDVERALAQRPDLMARLAAATSATNSGPSAPATLQRDVSRAKECEQRYLRTGDRASLDAAAEAWSKILDSAELSQAEERFRLAIWNDAGGGFLRRYWASGRLPDLNRAVELWQQAVAHTSPDSPALPSLLNNLGNGMSSRYARTGRLEDLEEAIRVYQQAIARTPPDSPDLPGGLNNLGTGLSSRYARTGCMEDLKEAIRSYQQAVARTPPDSPDLPMYLNNLGTGLSSDFVRTGRLENLEEAIRVYQQAVARTPPDSPDVLMYLNNLGTGLSSRYIRAGRLEDLDEAIRVYEQAVARTPTASPDLPSRLNNLGAGLNSRYARTGRLEDLEEAIRVYQQAVARTPPNSPDRPGGLNNLGSGLRSRYARTGRLEDLEEAIRVSLQAVACTPSDSPDLPRGLNNLGAGLRSRYARTGRLEDLEEAIRVYQQAVARTPPDSPDLPSRLSSLGNGLSTRYARTGRLEDLEESIRVYEQAVARTPLGSPDLPGGLNNLGTGLSSRYARTGRLEDLEETIRVYQQAVARTPPDSPALPSRLNNLGTGLSSRYARTGRLEDLVEGRKAYRSAIERGGEVSVESALVSARTWASWAIERQAWPEAHQAYDTVFALMDRLQREQVQRSDKEAWLRETQGVAARAAYAAAKTGQLESAVTALETGRARLLTEALEQNRRELESLPELGHADALAQYRAAAEEIQQLRQSPRAESETASPEIVTSDAASRHQRLIDARRRLDEAVAAIRRIPGFEDWLATPTWPRISRGIAAGASVVYLVTVDAGSLALVVRRTEQSAPPESRAPASVTVTSLWLDDFRESDLNDLLIQRTGDEITGGYLPGQLGHHDSLSKSLDRALDELGEKLMGPLAQALATPGESSAPSLAPSNATSGAPTITLIPVGHLALLPLHAARYVRLGAPTTFLDEFNVHFGISALSLDKARTESRVRRTARPRLVGIGNPQPDPIRDPGRKIGKLSFAKAELQCIADFWPAADRTAHYERDATGDALTAALPGAAVAHLSCHGYFRPDEPLESGLVLADRDVTLRALLDSGARTLGGCRLAVLSACQTAIQDFSKLPDEAIGLPGVLAQVGVPAVVGTLWPVADASTALLMVRFYELALDKDRPPPPHVALRTAQLWLRELTNEQLIAYLNRHVELAMLARSQPRMPMTALDALLFPFDGRDLDDPHGRPFSAPYFWAPFVVYGAEELLR